MKRIVVNTAFWTGLEPAFSSVQTIEIEDEPLAEGGFGVLFRALTINGRKTPPQIIKLLKDNGNGLALRGITTVRELQRRLELKNRELLASTKRSLLENLPALLAVPQFSFEGHIDGGRQVFGYSANDLAAAGLEEFGTFLEDDAKVRNYQALPLSKKLQVARQLVTAFDFLSSHVLYIHADFKAEALFIDPQGRRCAIIDFDSGALARDLQDQPSTFGTAQDWLAPEIFRQLASASNKAKEVRVDLHSDVWSVNVAIHYLLFGFHPYFFLTEISDRCIKAYLRVFRWPTANPAFPYFRKELLRAHRQYVECFERKIPKEIAEKFRFTFNHGFVDPAQRTSYGQWKVVLQAANRPAIKRFEADRVVVTDARPVRLSWDVTGAARLELEPVGDMTGRNSIEVIVRRDTVFRLKLVADDGSLLTKEIGIAISKETPKILSFMADRQLITDTHPVRLSWKVTGAAIVVIDGVGDVTGRSEVEIPAPRSDVSLTLTASSLLGITATATIQIEVCKEPPRIELFEADPDFLVDAQPVELRWRVSDSAHEVSLAGIGRVPRVGSVTVYPNRDQRYILRAMSFFGYSATKEVHIRVSKNPPRVELFRVEPAWLREGEDAEIAWRVIGATVVRIAPLVGNVPSEGRLKLKPLNSTTLTLIAESPFGVQSRANAVVSMVRQTKLSDHLTPLLVKLGTPLGDLSRFGTKKSVR